MDTDLRLTEADYLLLGELFSPSFRSGRCPEAGAIGILGECRAGDKHEFLLAKLFPPGLGDLKHAHHDHLVFDSGYIRRALPIDLDVLRYEAATASMGAAFTVGTWLTRSLFVAYRRRLAARPDENTNEAEAEYWITRRIMLEGVLGDRGVSGLDLLWRKRY